MKKYHSMLTDLLVKLGHSADTYPFSDLFQDYQDAMIPAVGVAMTILPGLVRDKDGDEVDSKENIPISDKAKELVEELIEEGLL